MKKLFLILLLITASLSYGQKLVYDGVDVYVVNEKNKYKKTSDFVVYTVGRRLFIFNFKYQEYVAKVKGYKMKQIFSNRIVMKRKSLILHTYPLIIELQKL